MFSSNLLPHSVQDRLLKAPQSITRQTRRCNRTLIISKAKTSTSVLVPSTPHPQHAASGNTFVWAALIVQSVALVGACTGGWLARKRRHELEVLSTKLRSVNAELRKQREADLHVCEADGDAEAMRSYRAALEVALETTSNSHPIQNFGMNENKLSRTRREFSRSLQDGREYLRVGDTSEALYLVNKAIDLSKEMKDLKAERSATKLKARVHRATGNLVKALKCLRRSLELSEMANDRTGDADVLGDIGDIYAEMGNYERAGNFYDLCCEVIKDDDFADNLSPYWDC